MELNRDFDRFPIKLIFLVGVLWTFQGHLSVAKEPLRSRTPSASTASKTTSASPAATKSPASSQATPSAAVAPAKQVLSTVQTGHPDICDLRNQSPSRISWGWLYLDQSYQGEPPALPSQGAVTISKVQLQGVYLGSSFSSTNQTLVTTLDNYLSFLAGSTYLTDLSPYGVTAGTAVAGKVIPDTLPQYGSTSTFLQDQDIANTLATNIQNGTLTSPTSSTVYVVYIEPGVAVEAGNSTSIDSFLGYHNVAQFTDSQNVLQTIYYAVLPYPGSPNPTVASQGFANEIDELTAVTSHEVAESITDPDTVNGWQETLKETIALKTIWGWVLFKFSFPMAGEEIADVPLILNNSSSDCYTRLNGYQVQKVISTDGVTMITPTGSAAKPAAASSKSTKARFSLKP